ncbi:MAG TPA: sialidase family protein [Candidatus Polarisedimenticolaceae bacterium]|nr:sialidase family protein [Candidatus Polarisedimenticolaceae bacterium]
MKRRALLVVLTLAACAAPPPTLQVREIPSPAGSGSAEPELTAGAGGQTILSWIEPRGEGAHTLRYAVWQDDGWSNPFTLPFTSASLLVNWADFPSVTALDHQALLAHWPTTLPDAPGASAVLLSRSIHDGEGWSDAATPHDASPTEHGFVSTVPLPDGRAAVVWLDGRETGGHEGEGRMTLRSAVLGTDGRVLREDLVDDRVCDCCQTSAVALQGGGLLVVYRDRSQDEIRDISVATFDGTRWSGPRPVHLDGWEIPGCPVNGPSIAALGDKVAVAWFTGAGGKGHVRVARSHDGGRSFDGPTEVDLGDPLGRVDVVLLDDGTPLVSWVEVQDGAARILVRRAPGDDVPGPPLTVATTSKDRPSGFPRMVRTGTDALLAWSDTSWKRVRTAAIRLP